MNSSPDFKAQPWFDSAAYPFSSHYFDMPEGKMHYLDEGEGEPLVLLHGTPAWSFLWRKFVAHFSKKYRVIAPDLLGFGLSDKPSEADFRPETQSRRIEQLMEHLGLEGVTLVVHDFGGPTGLGWAVRKPERVKRLIVCNTWAWETASNPDVKKIDRLVGGWLGKLLYLNFNFSPRVLLKQGFARGKVLTRQLHAHYLRVFPSRKDRHAPLAFARALAGSSDYYASIWAEREKLAGKPMLICWGMEDKFLGRPYFEKFKKAFPKAKTAEFKAGHFLQEECPKEMIRAWEDFLNEGD